MDFETMDWEVEAKRVGADQGQVLKLADASDSIYEEHPKIGDTELSVEYTPHYRYFSLERFHANMIGLGATEVRLHNDGTVRRVHHNDRYAAPMAEALFCLGLLTPKIEAALEVMITGHEKIQLALAFNERVKEVL